MHDPTAAFARLVADAGDDVALDEAFLLVAAHALPGLDVAAEQARLDELAAGVAERTGVGVCRHLVDVAGLRGDRETYHEAANSLLPLVLDRRRGIPLSLAVIAIEVARRCGVPLLGIGMPGHFLVRSADDEARFVDVFDGARLLDREDCRAAFEALHPGQGFVDRYLQPVTNLAMVTRLLANLANAYRRNGDRRALSWVLDLRLRLPGVSDRERREAAVVLGAAGRYDEAATVLEAIGGERDAHAALRMRARLN